MRDLDELALAMPLATKEMSEDGRPTYSVHGKFFCFHRSRRPDAVDPETGDRLDDVFVFRVADLGEKEILLRDDRGVFFTTPHWNGYSAVLMRIPDLGADRSRRAARSHRRGVADPGAEARREGVARRAGNRRGLTAQRLATSSEIVTARSPRRVICSRTSPTASTVASRVGHESSGGSRAGRPSWRTTMSPGARSARTRRAVSSAGSSQSPGIDENHTSEPARFPTAARTRSSQRKNGARQRRGCDADLVECLGRPAHLLVNLRLVEGLEVGVRPRVVADLVASVEETPDDGAAVVGRHRLPDHEECPAPAVALEVVGDGKGPRGRPVVERERDDGVGDPATRLDEWHRAWHGTTLGRAACARARTRSGAPVVEPPELLERRAGSG